MTAAGTIEVDVKGRWDACALSESLSAYQSFLVQHERQHWVVYAHAPGWHGEQLGDALAAIARCLRERGVEDAEVRVDGRRLSLDELLDLTGRKA